MKNICFITATRAEYFLLSRLMKKVQQHDKFNLQIIVTGAHLSHEFGLTYKDIENDGFEITEKVEILLSSDTPIGISKTMGLATISFSEAFERISPDLVVILGDRYEMLPIASVCNIFNIPIAHLHGGEKTEGAVDESIRHALTKISYLHFTSTNEYMQRVIQLGEEPNRVYNVGALGIENIKNTKLLTKQELEENISFDLGDSYALTTFHPVTLENNTSQQQFENLITALERFNDLKVIFTKANSDTDGRVINSMIDEVVSKNPQKYIAFTSMGILRYLSAMKYCKFVLGNSSSGLVETPSFGVPTVNIGDRQKGRIRAKSVIDCEPQVEDITDSINKSLNSDFKDVLNPYGDGDTSSKIIEVIEEFVLDDNINIKKTFHDIDF